MSESDAGGTLNAAGTAHDGPPSGAVDTAKDEARDVAGAAKAEAGHVAGTVKEEAANVAGEARRQVKDLYHQTQGELREQAAAQQQRVADGLRAVGGELSSMVDTAESPGIAADLVGQVSTRIEGVASWLGDRDPGSLLAEVKQYARRKPGTFIAVAALAGLAVGRLTRALAESAAEENDSPRAAPAQPSAGEALPPVPPVPADLAADDAGVATPVYEQSRAAWDDSAAREGNGDVRRDSF